MKKLAHIAIAATLLVGGTSLATAKSRGVVHAHGSPSRRGINKTTARPVVADPYYRLSDSYYGYSDPYRGLFDIYAMRSYIPGYSYGHVRLDGLR
jgi:hypothetical protein